MSYLYGKIFKGLHTNADARTISPNRDNADKEGGFEAVEMTNFDILGEGAMITSKGYELVSKIAGTGGILNLMDYEQEDADRYLLITHEDKHYSITAANTVWSSTNLGSYGVEASYVGGVVYNAGSVQATGTITITAFGDLLSGSNQDLIKIGEVEFIAQAGAATAADATFQALTTNNATANSLCIQINYHKVLNKKVIATVSGAIVTITSKQFGEEGNGIVLQYTNNTGAVGLTVSGAALTGGAGSKVALLGYDSNSNNADQIDIANPMTTDLGGVKDGHIMAVFMGRIFVADGRVLNYSEVENTGKLGSSISFNDDITGLVVEGQRLIVLTKTYNQGVYFDYNDEFNLSTPLKEPYERKYGCLAPKSVAKVSSSAYYWSQRGVMMLGTEEGFDDSGLPRPQSKSKKIENILESTNKAYRLRANAIHWEAKRQYWLAAPYGVSQVPDKTLVYWEDWNAWTLRDGFYPGDMEMFKNSSYEDELHFGDANSPYLYKFNDEYSYDGAGYTRKWKSKIFTMGTNLRYKEHIRLDLTGAMDAGTVFYITLDVDGKRKKYKVDNTFLINNAYGEYIGDTYVGDEWVGGSEPAPSGRFKRFYAPLDFPKQLREGMELQITIENSAPEQPFKIDFLGIEYNTREQKQVPGRNYVNTEVTI